MTRTLCIILFTLGLLAGCSRAEPASVTTAEASAATIITVYKSPT